MNLRLQCLCLLLSAGCATVPITGRQQLSLVPRQQMVALSEENFQQILSQAPLSADPVKVRLVESTGIRLAASAERFMDEQGLASLIEQYDWEFRLIEDDRVNAFCMAGGKVGVFTGILPIVKDESGLAVVMAHEIAHDILNHSGERMSELLLVRLGGSTLSQALAQSPAQTREFLMTAYGIGTDVGFLLPFSRRQELEADRVGLLIMAQAGYDPERAVSFWQTMGSLSGEDGIEFLSTHPVHQKRVEEINRWLPEARQYYEKTGA